MEISVGSEFIQCKIGAVAHVINIIINTETFSTTIEYEWLTLKGEKIESESYSVLVSDFINMVTDSK